MTPMYLKELDKILCSRMLGTRGGKSTVTAIAADSRQIVKGAVFVAVKGAVVDGHDFIEQAVEKGCLAVVAEHLPDVVKGSETPCFLVEDSHAALANLAAAWYGYPAAELKLIGLTGTNGKTTTSWLLENVLQQAGAHTGVIGTVNYRYQDAAGKMVVHPAPLTTPDPLQLQALLREMVEAKVSHVLIEASSHALVQKRLVGINFDVALFTNLSRDHLDYHHTMEEYYAAKKKLFTSFLKDTGVPVVVVDSMQEEDTYGKRLASELGLEKVITVGFSENCTVRGEQVQQGLEGTSCVCIVEGQQHLLRTPLTGGHNVLNMLAAAGVVYALLEPLKDACAGLAAVERVPGRLERVRLPGILPQDMPSVFVDYAHTPDGLENVLKSLQAVTPGRLIVVFGCGGDRDKGKRFIMGEVAGRLADAVVVTSDNPRSEEPMKIIAEIERGVKATGKGKVPLENLFATGVPENGYQVVADRKTAIQLACSLSRPDDVVVLAGKGHEQYQINGKEKVFFDDRIEAKNGLTRWTIPHLLAATKGRLIGPHQQVMFREVSTDTRSLQSGDVFVALSGESFDGHAFIDTAMEKGAGALIVEQDPARRLKNIPIIKVADTLKALGDLAAYRRRLLGSEVKVVAITGSSGKTTVKEMTASIFEQFNATGKDAQRSVLKTKGNFNNLIGLPLSLLPLGAEHKVAVLEMGMNRAGEIARLTEIADPDIGCINNIQAAHLEGLGSIDGVAAAKAELFAGLMNEAIKVVNYDDPQVVRVAAQYDGHKIGYAVSAAGRRRKPVVKVTRIAGYGEQGSRFTLQIGDWKERILLSAPGIHSVHNAAAAAAICHAAGVDQKSIVEGLSSFQAVDKRMQFMDLPGGLKVLNDCYNANPSSMAAALQTVATFGTNCRRVAALGDMLELGDRSAAAHQEVGRLAATLGYDLLAVTGASSREVAAGARKGGMAADQVMEFVDTVAMADWLYHLLISGRLSQDDWLLVKGSRGMRMENLIVELQNRFDPAHQKV